MNRAQNLFTTNPKFIAGGWPFEIPLSGLGQEGHQEFARVFLSLQYFANVPKTEKRQTRILLQPK